MSQDKDRKPLLSKSRVHASHGLSSGPIQFPKSQTSVFGDNSEDAEWAEERRILSRSRRGQDDEERGSRTDEDVVNGFGNRGRREGIPKLTRECLWSEIKCYGSYILPVFLVFGVGVIGIALFLVGLKRGWFRH